MIKSYRAAVQVYMPDTGWVDSSRTFTFWAPEGMQDEYARSLRKNEGAGTLSYYDEAIVGVTPAQGQIQPRNTVEDVEAHLEVMARANRGGAHTERKATLMGERGVMVSPGPRQRSKFISLEVLEDAARQEDPEGARVYGLILRDAKRMWGLTA